jgi:hypothetical protein
MKRKMKCPICQSAMELEYRHGIEKDVCPECGGVWLDRGELEHAMNHSELAAASKSSSPSNNSVLANKSPAKSCSDLFDWF